MRHPHHTSPPQHARGRERERVVLSHEWVRGPGALISRGSEPRVVQSAPIIISHNFRRQVKAVRSQISVRLNGRTLHEVGRAGNVSDQILLTMLRRAQVSMWCDRSLRLGQEWNLKLITGIHNVDSKELERGEGCACAWEVRLVDNGVALDSKCSFHCRISNYPTWFVRHVWIESRRTARCPATKERVRRRKEDGGCSGSTQKSRRFVNLSCRWINNEKNQSSQVACVAPPPLNDHKPKALANGEQSILIN